MTPANRNLLVRALTAAVLLPIVLWLIAHGGVPFALLIAAAAAAAAFEVNGLPWAPREQGAAPAPGRAVSISLCASVLVAGILPLLEQLQHPWLTPGWLVGALVIVSLTDALFFELDQSRAPLRVGLAVLGASYPGLLLSALVPLRQLPDGAGWIVMALTVTWMN